MTRVRTLFLLLTIVGPLHMAEQMLTGLDEFHAIRAVLTGRYYGLFQPASADLASVVLITIVWTVVSLFFLALLWEGAPRLAAVGAFGLFGATEIHHVVESLMTRGYDPGVVTSVPYAVVGCLLLAAVTRERRGPGPILATERSAA